MLPNKFKPLGLYDLVRLGKNNDGGYLVCKNNVKESDCLISFGINDDFSFEETFKLHNKNEIFAFDPTVTNKFFYKNILLNLIKVNFNLFFKCIKNFYNFKKFFNKNNNFIILKRVGKGGNISEKNISISEILNLCAEKKNIFFKIDIEGSEYRILDDLLKYEEVISGIVIEFHEVDLNLDKILNFIEHSQLKLIHIHANNWMNYGQNNIPTCIEMTFSKNPTLISDNVVLPHVLDQKNNPNAKDLILKFKN